MALGIPSPLPNELPADYANRVGEWYMSWNKPKKALGQFFTPLSVARYMAHLIPIGHSPVRVLDPGAGLGILACALCEVSHSDIELEVYEIDAELAEYLNACLEYARQWMKARNRNLQYRVVQSDFVLAQAKSLYHPTIQPFDIVISNPPYFKLSKNDPRTQATEIIVHGQPNIYAIFMAISAALLRQGGYGVFITPRSYTAGQYFSRFRDYFFARMRPRAIHLFESRSEVFSDVLQESLILLAEHSLQNKDVVLSSSANGTNFHNIPKRIIPCAEIIGTDNVLHIPLSEQARQIAEVINAWPGNLHKYDMEISTGPVVAYRADHLIVSSGNVPATHAPLLWMQNIKPMHCEWPQNREGQFIIRENADKLLLPNQNYVLLRRFSAKEERQRLTAAPYFAHIDTPLIGIENHVNYIYRPKGYLSDDETRGLTVLLNSGMLDAYFRLYSGSTQVNASEIRRLPLPPLNLISEIGRLAASESSLNCTVLINEVLGIYA